MEQTPVLHKHRDKHFDPIPNIESEPYRYRTKTVSTPDTRYGIATMNRAKKKVWDY